MTGENHVDVDLAALQAEAARVELPPDPAGPPAGEVLLDPQQQPGEPTLEQLQASALQWKGGADFMVNAVADVIAPNWRVTMAEREQLSQSIALALAAWFPDDRIPLKYMVLLGVGGSVWAIASARREQNGGKFPPLRLPPPKAATNGASAPASAPASAAGTASSTGNGGFTTSV